MSHIFRFIGKPKENDERSWIITGDELVHLSKVLRLKTGTQVEVTNGGGLWACGTLASISKQLAMLEAEKVHQVARSNFPITIIMAALERPTMDDLIAPLTEIGVERLIIFQQAIAAKARLHEKYADRWRKIALGSIKQCKGAWTLEIHMVKSLGEALTGIEQESNKIFLDETVREPLLINFFFDARPSYLVLGSELGFADEERALLVAAGFLSTSLGPNILRAPTAAISTASHVALRRQLWK